MSERLWAPWRMDFVTKGYKDDRCLFCRVNAENDDESNYVLTRGLHTLLMLNAYPYTNGHLMTAPLRHTAEFDTLSPDELAEMMAMAQRGMAALRAVYRPDGFNVGMNLGSAGGAGIADHLHLHIVPRWSGDTNFMPVVGDVRVMPESLDASYRRIKSALDSDGERS